MKKRENGSPNYKRRGLACILAAALVIGVLPIGVLAADEDIPLHEHNANGWTCAKELTCIVSEALPEQQIVLGDGNVVVGGGAVGGGADAPMVPDAGTTPDVGTTPDSGTEPDAGTTPDAGTEPDAGTTPDAGSSDAGSSDAGSSDAGSSDAGSSDAGSSDAGSSDAGSSDAGSSDTATMHFVQAGIQFAAGPEEETHIHTETCYSWICTPPATEAPSQQRSAMDLTSFFTGDSSIKAMLSLDGKELDPNTPIKEADLKDKPLALTLDFDLPVDKAEYNEDELVSPGAPIEGDTITFALPEAFKIAKDGETAPEPKDLIVRDAGAGTGTSVDIAIGNVVWDTDANELKLTFTSEMPASQDRWASLNGCRIEASVWYNIIPSTDTEITTEIKLFDKTFIVEKENELAAGYTLTKSVMSLAGTDLGANFTDIASADGANAAISLNGEVTWKVVATATGDKATFAGLTLQDVLTAANTGDAMLPTIVSATLQDGEGQSAPIEFTDGKYTWGAEPISKTQIFMITTKMTPEFWLAQGTSAWDSKRTLTNTAVLLSTVENGSKELLKAAASVSFKPVMVQKNGSIKGATQSWTIKANPAGRTIKNAYIVDEMTNVKLADAKPIKIGTTVATLAESKAPNTYAVSANGTTSTVTIYLGDISAETVITVATTTVKSGALNNKATLYGTYDNTTDFKYGSSEKGLSTAGRGLNKAGLVTSTDNQFEWSINAIANSNEWSNGIIFDFIVPNLDRIKLTEAQWAQVETALDVGGGFAAIKRYYTNNPTKVAAYQELVPNSVSVSNGDAVSGTIMDGNTVIAYYAAAKFDGHNKNSTLKFRTNALKTDTMTSWNNTAPLFDAGSYAKVASAHVDIAKQGNDFIKKETVAYDYAMHTASWKITVNPQGRDWATYIVGTDASAEDVYITDTLPEGWTLDSVKLNNEAVTATGGDDGSAISWGIEPELRNGKQKLIYTVTATILDPKTYLDSANEKITVKNSVQLWIKGASKGSAECSFVINNGKPGKTAVAGENQDIIWTIKVNEGERPYTRATVEDVLPQGLTPVMIRDAQGKYSPAVTAWYIAHNAKGEAVKGNKVDVAASYSSASRTVSISLPEASRGYFLEFTTNVNGTVNPAGYSNIAKYITDQESTSTNESKVSKADIKVTAGNGVQYGTIIVNKESPNAEKIHGAGFALTGNKSGALYMATTDEDGVARFEGIRSDETYALEEIKAAPGYAINKEFNEAHKSIVMKSDGKLYSLTIKCVNKLATATISLVKQGISGNALPGVKFGLFASDAGKGEALQSVTTDEDGYASFAGLAVSTDYYVFETEALPGYTRPIGYLLKASVDANGLVSYTKPDGSVFDKLLNGIAPIIVNQKHNSIKIDGIKHLFGDDNQNIQLNGGEFVFDLIDSNANLRGTATNANDGSFSFTLSFSEERAGSNQESAKTYTYTISERNGADTAIKYDATTYTYTVSVWKDTDGNIKFANALLAKTDAADQSVELAEFTNHTIKKIPPTPIVPIPPVDPPAPINPPTPTNPTDPSNPSTGGNDDPTPRPTPNPDVTILDGETPLNGLEAPVAPIIATPEIFEDPLEEFYIFDDEIPLGRMDPTNEVIIIDDDVPLGSLPQTGARGLSPIAIILILALSSGLCITGVSLVFRKEKQ